MFEIEPPRTRDDLLAALAAQQQEIADYLRSFALDELFAEQGEHWSPAGHLEHLNKSVRPLAQALHLPKAALLLRFGPSLRRSKRYEQVREWYQNGLKSGIQAGRYGPSTKVDVSSPETRRQRLLDHWDDNGKKLREGIRACGDLALDRCRVKHPALGAMTLREILYFTLHHNAHHARRIAERRVQR